MTAKTCPHCNHDVPPEFAVMPVCMMCGGNLSEVPSQVWEKVDIQNETRSKCPQCNAEIPSVLDVNCASCGVLLRKTGPLSPDALPPTPPVPDTAPVFDLPEPVVTAASASLPPVVPPPAPDSVRAELPSFGAPPSPAPSTPIPAQEGFFAKLLRMLGLKK